MNATNPACAPMEHLICGECEVLEHIGNGVYINFKNQKVFTEIDVSSTTVLCDEKVTNEENVGATGTSDVLTYNEARKVPHYIVNEKLGLSLERLLQAHRFSLTNICLLIEQMLSCIEHLHEQTFIHSNLTPQSFYMGSDKNCNKVYLVDVGISKKIIINNQHISFQEDWEPTGTPIYSSLNVHRGIHQSRRDDMESLGYILMEFCKGTLPWNTLDQKDPNWPEQIYNMKLQRLRELCDGLPHAFILYIYYSRTLGYYKKPNYRLLRLLFRTFYATLNGTRDIHFAPRKTDHETNKDNDTIRYDYIDEMSASQRLSVVRTVMAEGDLGDLMENLIRAHILEKTALLGTNYVDLLEEIRNLHIDDETSMPTNK